MSTYRWVIRSKSINDLICNGYARQNFNKYISHPIIRLFICYFTKYSYALEDIKHSKGPIFSSTTFALKSFKWYCRLFSADPYLSSQDSDKLILGIVLTFMPPNLHSLEISFTLRVKETNTEVIENTAITNDDPVFIWPINTLSMHEIKHLRQMTFEIEINILSVTKNYDIDSTPITEYVQENKSFPGINDRIIELPTVKYVWNINDSIQTSKIKQRLHIYSPVFATGQFKWYLEISPSENKEYVMMGLTLASMPDNTIAKVAVYATLALQQTQTVHPITNVFNYKNNYCCWTDDILSFQQIKDLKELKFSCAITICDVYNNSDNVVPHFIELHSQRNQKIISLSTTDFEWKVSNTKIIDTIETRAYVSPIFTLSNFAWCLRLFCGRDDKAESGNVNVYLRLNLVSTPIGISKISARCKLQLVQTNTVFLISLNFDSQNKLTFWPKGTLRLSEMKKLSALNFKVEITILECYDLDQEILDNYVEKLTLLNQVNQPQLTVLPCSEYKWQITNTSNINDINDLASPIFELFNVKWCVTLVQSKGSIAVMLKLLSYLSLNTSLRTNVETHIIETGDFCSECHRFSNNSCSSSNYMLNLKSHNTMQRLNQFTVHIRITLIDVYKNNEILTEQYSNNIISKEITVVPSKEFKWEISKKSLNKIHLYANGEGLESEKFEMFQCQYYLKLYPMGQGLTDIGSVTLGICSEPQLTTLAIRCTIMLKELNVKLIESIIFSERRTKTWLDIFQGTQLTDVFRELNECTIVCQMELIDAYDTHNKIVTDTLLSKRPFNIDFEHKFREIVQMEMQSVTREFTAQLNQLKEKIESIEETLIKNKSRNDTVMLDDEKANEFKIWLYDEVELREYYKIFIENGVDKLSIVKLLTINELKEMGINKIGHTVKLLYEIDKLNQTEFK